ncbi:DNA polymerase delta subunit 4 [Cryptococcus neoformans Ze90-1]|nr:DNA polymerase delta subunit 4 [Cryptococcus neoformans var. grubii Ze90-1]
MPPRKGSSTIAKSSGKTKRAAGLSQPTLGFQSQRKHSGAMSKSKPSLQRQTSTISEINVEPEERGDIDIELLAGSNTKDKKTHMGEKKSAESSVLPEQRTEDGEPRQLKVKSKEWAQVLKAAKEAMGNLEPIHADSDTHNDIHHILRVFDMTAKYGPCVGISRLDRWKRAQKLGLEPPEEIRTILTTQQGQEDPSYRENVLSAWL